MRRRVISCVVVMIGLSCIFRTVILVILNLRGCTQVTSIEDLMKMDPIMGMFVLVYKKILFLKKI